MRTDVDIVVVGGGPAGSMAAQFAAREGASVLLLEKDREIGIPVRCAEGISKIGLTSHFEPKPEWITRNIKGLMLYPPSGKKINVSSNQVGYILDRKRFDYDLAQMAAAQGADIQTRAYVHDLVWQNDTVDGVRVRLPSRDLTIRCKIVIGADGVESRVGRWAGIDTRARLKDIETCMQATVSGIDIDPDLIHFFFSQKGAPGGYTWIFPKGEDSANIGLGISGEHARHHSAYEHLKFFLDEQFPHASVLTWVAGAVPCSKPLVELVKNRVMLVGDAAHQVNPLSGGGISAALYAGKIAGMTAGQAVRSKDLSHQRLSQYEKQWREKNEKRMNRYYRLKEFIYTINDDEFERIADSVLKKPTQKRTIVNVFKAALITKPSLIIDMIKVFT